MAKSSIMNLTHHFLIAMPNMGDPRFAGAVVYIHEHDEQGALGFIVNQPAGVELGAVFDSVSIKSPLAEPAKRPVYVGGPLATEQGFVLHAPTERNWEHSDDNGLLLVTNSQDILHSMADDTVGCDYLFCLGYAGWAGGQVEDELKANDWLSIPASSSVVFNSDNEAKYEQALNILGISRHTLAAGGCA